MSSRVRTVLSKLTLRGLSAPTASSAELPTATVWCTAERISLVSSSNWGTVTTALNLAACRLNSRRWSEWLVDWAGLVVAIMSKFTQNTVPMLDFIQGAGYIPNSDWQGETGRNCNR